MTSVTMLVAAYILATIEKWLRKVIPTVLDNLLTPLLSILVTAFLTFLFVGPLTRQLGYGYQTDNMAIEFGGAIGGFIFGLFSANCYNRYAPQHRC